MGSSLDLRPPYYVHENLCQLINISEGDSGGGWLQNPGFIRGSSIFITAGLCPPTLSSWAPQLCQFGLRVFGNLKAMLFLPFSGQVQKSTSIALLFHDIPTHLFAALAAGEFSGGIRAHVKAG